MEDLGDFLYIIFAIIGVVYSLIRKNSKKAEKATPPINPMDDDTNPYGEDIPSFEKIFGNEEPNTVPKPKVVPATKINEGSAQSMEEKKRQIERSFTRVKSVKTKEEPKPTEEILVEEKVGFDFDLRQAVIYSEVLKRPEF